VNNPVSSEPVNMPHVETQQRGGTKSPLLLIFLTVFIDLIGFGIVIPILPIYAATFHVGPSAIGLLMGSYSLAQFFCTPLLGSISDRVGRRPVLIVSVLGTSLAFLTMGLAGAFWVLLAARTFDGITGGNIGTAQAYIADVTRPEERAKGMGLIGAAFGLGFIFGPAIGGVLSHHFGLSSPFYFSAALALVNAILIYFMLPESLRERQHGAIHLGAHFSRIWHAVRRPELSRLVLIFFVATLAFGTYQSMFSLFAAAQYGYTPDQLGYLFAYAGIIGVIVQGGLVRQLVKHASEGALMIVGFVLLAVSFFAIPFTHTLAPLLAALGVMSVGSALASNLLPAQISQRAGVAEQGSILGITQSAGSLARFIGPVWGGLLLNHLSPGAPFLACGVLAVLALALSWRRAGQLGS
jgi:DHA1 family tetracycline resistance protein-like MFS transporter